MRRLLTSRFVFVSLAIAAIAACGFNTEKDPPPVKKPPGPTGLPVGPAPVLPQTMQAVAPPAISGGTIELSPDGNIAVISDPDRDLVHVIDVRSDWLLRKGTIALNPHDEPGRIAFDGEGHAYVALRRGGALVTVDLEKGELIDRRDVCGAPRGVAWNGSKKEILVACATGELVSLAQTGAPTRTKMIATDLRDVVVGGPYADQIYVSRFRSAEVILLDQQSWIESKRIRPTDQPGKANTAWRLRSDGRSLYLLYQRSTGAVGPIGLTPVVYYGQGCGAVVTPTVAVFTRTTSGAADAWQDVTSASAAFSSGSLVSGLSLAVDFAIAPGPVLPTQPPTPNSLFVVAPGNAHTRTRATIASTTSSLYSNTGKSLYETPCGAANPNDPQPALWGEFIGITASANKIFIHQREPDQLLVVDVGQTKPRATMALSNVSVEDSGHAMFHANSGATISCASCHPEGGDDGLVWQFSTLNKDGSSGFTKARRTATLQGTLDGSAPYHWDGDLADLDALMKEVFVSRMRGPEVSQPVKEGMKRWLLAQPAPKAPAITDAAAVARGKIVFETRGCTGCHAGALGTDNGNHHLAPNEMLQTPPLVGLAYRAPYLHDGCAKTLADRFSPACRSAAHGVELAPNEITDVVAYLESR